MKTRPIRTVEDIRRTITEIFSGKNVKVYLFGSRARGDHTLRSDLDLGFLSDDDIRYELSVLREILEESHVPFRVDVVDLSRVDPEFRNHVMEEGVLWIVLSNS